MRAPASEQVVSVLVENHRGFLRFLEGRVGTRQDAEEILQAAFVRAWERGGAIEDEESAVAWFYRLLRNAVIDHYRHQDVQRRALEREARDPPEPPAFDPAMEQLVCQCIHDLLPTINEGYAALIRRVDLERAPIAQIAQESGTTVNNTRVKLHRARQALGKQLQRSCGTCADHGCLDCTCDKAPPAQ
jgi:RNA polymerase sigma-70 factor (ECF subfamily)